MAYWLMKSEPDVFGIDHLKGMYPNTEPWDGIRNYQARNFMRDQMKKGDLSFFYHSNCKEPGIYGTMKIVSETYPDETAFDPNAKYYDPNSSEDNPRWYLSDVKFVKKFNTAVLLSDLRQYEFLDTMKILQKGNRLSVTPISTSEWNFITKLTTA